MTKKRNIGRFKVLNAQSLQAVVVVRLPFKVTFVESLVCVCAEHGGFDSRVLKHALCPLLQLRCAVKQAEKTKGVSLFTKDQMFPAHEYIALFCTVPYICILCSFYCASIFFKSFNK